MNILAGFFSGLLGSMGLGGGSILIIYLTLFRDYQQVNAQGINLIFFIVCATVSTIVYTIKKQIKFKEIAFVVLGGIVGAFIGQFVLKQISSDLLPKIFGVFLILMGITSLLKSKSSVVTKEKVW